MGQSGAPPAAAGGATSELAAPSGAARARGICQAAVCARCWPEWVQACAPVPGHLLCLVVGPVVVQVGDCVQPRDVHQPGSPGGEGGRGGGQGGQQGVSSGPRGTRTHTHMHARTHARQHARQHAHSAHSTAPRPTTRVHTHAGKTLARAHAHAHAHALAHTHTHTHTHTGLAQRHARTSRPWRRCLRQTGSWRRRVPSRRPPGRCRW